MIIYAIENGGLMNENIRLCIYATISFFFNPLNVTEVDFFTMVMGIVL